MSFQKPLIRFPEGINNSDYVIATYYVETFMDPHRAADAFAAEQSTGTWMRVKYESDERRERFGAQAIGVYVLPNSPNSANTPTRLTITEPINAMVLRLAFPWINFGPLIPNLLSAVAGNLYEMGAFTAARLVDLEFPSSYTDHFTGPKFGLEGTRNILNVFDRPLFGAIVKPCVGLSVEEIAELAYQGAKGGLDFIKDDELIADTSYNSVRARTKAISAALKLAQEETGEKTMYAINITDRVDRVKELHDIVVDNGGNCVMVNVATLGIEALRELAEYSQVPIHVHRDFAPSFTRSPYTGMSTEVFTKICRLAGGDQIHCGAIGGKLYETDEEVLVNTRACAHEFHKIKTALPVSSGGQWAGKVAENCKKLGHLNFLHLSGAGTYAHPDGGEAGARSIRLAWEAFASGIPIEDYAVDHSELQHALNHFK